MVLTVHFIQSTGQEPRCGNITTSMKPRLAHRTLSSAIVVQLRQGILDGHYPAGTRLAEIPVANALGVSRTPVRLAFRTLQQEGLLQTVGKRGCWPQADVVIIDEAHHLTAETFEAVLKQASARYVLGLSATPVRSNGHHPIIFMQCGPVRHRVRGSTSSASDASERATRSTASSWRAGSQCSGWTTVEAPRP